MAEAVSSISMDVFYGHSEKYTTEVYVNIDIWQSPANISKHSNCCVKNLHIL